MRRLLLVVLLAGCGRSPQPLSPADLGTQMLVGDDGGADDCPSGLNSCGECAPQPIEECNGRDDDCNGIVDDGCSLLWPQLSPVTPPIRLHGDAVAAVQVGSFAPYDPVQSWQYRLLYFASAGAMPEVLAETPITDAGLQNESERDPDFDGVEVVWRKSLYYDDSTASVMAMSLTDRTPVTLSTGLTAAGAPAVSGGRVVFAATPSGQADADVFLFDLSTGKRTDLTFAGVFERAPDLSGEWLVYERRDTANGDAQIRALHLPDGALDGPSDGLDGTHTAPAIDGTTVVWSQQRTDPANPKLQPEVWLYDLGTRERRKLGDGQRARVDGNLICWDAPDGIWATDRASGRTARISTDGWGCDVSGRRVGWIGHQGLTYRDLTKDEP